MSNITPKSIYQVTLFKEQMQNKKYDRHGKIITHGFYKGHLTKAGKLWKALQWGKPDGNQVSDALSKRMSFPDPLDKHEQATAKANGLTLKNGYVVHEK